MGMTYDDDQHDGRSPNGAALLAAYRIWQGPVRVSGPVPLGEENAQPRELEAGEIAALDRALLRSVRIVDRYEPVSGPAAWRERDDIFDDYSGPDKQAVSGPAPLGVEGAYMSPVHPKTGSTDGPAWPVVRDPYIPAGCDQQGRIESGRRASEVASDWAGRQSEAVHKRVEWPAIAAAVLALVLAAGAISWAFARWG